MKLLNNLKKTNKAGRNMYGTSYLESIMPDSPMPNYRDYVHIGSKTNGRSNNSGGFQKSYKSSGRSGGVNVRGRAK